VNAKAGFKGRKAMKLQITLAVLAALSCSVVAAKGGFETASHQGVKPDTHGAIETVEK
jgi:hypothetical protein